MALDYKKVEVLMSTYNGVEYVGRQIDSILKQQNVTVHITIRDDGSNDDTLKVLKQIESINPTRIKIIEGQNIGYKRSFLTLLSFAEHADYYAFSDQDDIWEVNKLEEAIKLLAGKECVLYTSNLNLYSSDLHFIRKTRFKEKYCTIYSAFTRYLYAGCTFVFDNQIYDIISIFGDINLPASVMPSHDAIVAFTAFSCGNVLFDERTYIKHIRYENSVTAGGNGLAKRIKSELKTFSTNSRYVASAKLLLDRIPEKIHKNEMIFLQSVAFYKESLKKWGYLIFHNKMDSGNFIFNLCCKIRLIMRLY